MATCVPTQLFCGLTTYYAYFVQRPQVEWNNHPVSPTIWRSTLPERPRDLLAQRLEQILQRRALIGLDERLHRHSGNDLEIAETADLLLRQGGAHQVIGLVVVLA